MTITLDLPPEIEARFINEARDKGIPVADIVKAHLMREYAPGSVQHQIGPEEWDKQLDHLFDDLDAPAGVQEGAFHRKNWYL